MLTKDKQMHKYDRAVSVYLPYLQLLGSVQQIREVKVYNVVSRYDVWVHILNELTPSLWQPHAKGAEITREG